MQKINELDNLQVHYYLSDDSHSMDAKILNRVESELLKIVEEISRILDIEITIETQALEEGGIRSIYRFLTRRENKAKILIVGAFFAGIVGTVVSEVIADSINTDSEMEKLKREQVELQIKKLRLDIANDSLEKLHQRNDENMTASITTYNDGDEIKIDSELIDSISIYLGESNRVKIAKSKFYEYLLKEGKVEKVSTQVLDSNNKPKSAEKSVPRSDFKLFVINETIVEPDYKENITLEIVSPVLKRNRLSWKAIYDDKTVTFKLKDEDFKNMIVNKNLSFSNGTKIVCDVETKLKMNTNGDLVETGKSVYNVSKIIYPDGQVVDVPK